MAGEKSSLEYAMLPAGTIVKFGEAGDTVDKMKALINCKALGATRLTGGFIDCTTLKDTNKQSISDLPEGPEKSLGLLMIPAMLISPRFSMLPSSVRPCSFILHCRTGVQRQ